MSFDNHPRVLYARSLLAKALRRGYNDCHLKAEAKINEAGTELGDIFLHAKLRDNSGEALIDNGCLYVSESASEETMRHRFEERFPPINQALNKRFLASLEAATAAAIAAGIEPVQINPLLAMAELLRTNVLEDLRRDEELEARYEEESNAGVSF